MSLTGIDKFVLFMGILGLIFIVADNYGFYLKLPGGYSGWWGEIIWWAILLYLCWIFLVKKPNDPNENQEKIKNKK